MCRAPRCGRAEPSWLSIPVPGRAGRPVRSCLRVRAPPLIPVRVPGPISRQLHLKRRPPPNSFGPGPSHCLGGFGGSSGSSGGAPDFPNVWIMADRYPDLAADEGCVAKKSAVCPACSGAGIPLCGLATFQAGQAAERGEVVLGGCEVTGEDPDYRCAECEVRWEANGLDDPVPPTSQRGCRSQHWEQLS